MQLVPAGVLARLYSRQRAASLVGTELQKLLTLLNKQIEHSMRDTLCAL